MDDLSLREATRGVDADYSNASSHLFLANSYNALRDPTRVNLRYETPWFNELLLANLLSPVGGGPLSQFVSEQEYSKLSRPIVSASARPRVTLAAGRYTKPLLSMAFLAM